MAGNNLAGPKRGHQVRGSNFTISQTPRRPVGLEQRALPQRSLRTKESLLAWCSFAQVSDSRVSQSQLASHICHNKISWYQVRSLPGLLIFSPGQKGSDRDVAVEWIETEFQLRCRHKKLRSEIYRCVRPSCIVCVPSRPPQSQTSTNHHPLCGFAIIHWTSEFAFNLLI